MATLAVAIWATFGAGWDVAVYESAIRSLQAGHDPYLDAIARQNAYLQQLPLHPNIEAAPPYSYVYSPITLPWLRFIGRLPIALSGTIYWLIYGMGALAVLWTGMQVVEEEERRYLNYFAPMATFFPALLENGVILSGNIAYIIYGAALPAAMIGWKHGRWRWFYLVVLVASCCKAPYLTLLAIPILCYRNQWLPAASAAGIGCALFAMQRTLWPALFQHFLEAVDLQMHNFRDFGCSPAGILASYMLDLRMKSSLGGLTLYILYAVPLFLFLVRLSHKFFNGAFPFTRWMPVLLVGVMLLSPRIQEYDLAVLTIPMATIAWRALSSSSSNIHAKVWTAITFAALNIAASLSWVLWKDIACLVLVFLFWIGARGLLHFEKPIATAAAA